MRNSRYTKQQEYSFDYRSSAGDLVAEVTRLQKKLEKNLGSEFHRQLEEVKELVALDPNKYNLPVLQGFRDQLNAKSIQQDIENHRTVVMKGSDQLFELPTQEELGGMPDVPIGRIFDGENVYDTFWGLNLRDAPKSLLSYGPPGVGKTVLLRKIAVGFLEKGIPIWIFDSKSRDFCSLLKRFPDILVIRVPARMHWNLLEPQLGEMTFEHLNMYILKLAEIIKNALQLQIATQSWLLKNVMKPTYEECLKKGRFPTFFDLAKRLEDLPRATGREQGYAQSGENRLDIIMETLGQMMDCQSGFPLPELARRSVIFDLGEVGDEVAEIVFQEAIMSWLMMYRKVFNLKTPKIRIAVIFDEAEKLFAAAREHPPWKSNISELTRQARSFGMGFFIANQTLTTLSTTIRGCVGYKVVFPLSSGEDIFQTERDMNLEHDQSRYIGEKLDIGKIAAKQTFGYRKPLLVSIDAPDLEEVNYNSKDIDRLMDRRIEQIPWTPRKTSVQVAEDIQSEQQPGSQETGGQETEISRSPEEQFARRMGISDNAFRLLVAAAENPFTPMVDSGKNIGLSSNQIRKAANQLEKNGWAKKVSVKLRKRGGRPKAFLELFSETVQELKSQGRLEKGYLPATRGGGLEHCIIQMVILPAFFHKQEKQFKAEFGNADFVVRDEGRVIGYEIMISSDYAREYNNLCRNLHENGFDSVVFLTQTKEELEKLRVELIKRHGGLLPDTVDFKLVREFLT